MAAHLSQTYDPENFRSTGHQLIDLLADRLDAMQRGLRLTTQHSFPQQELEKWRKYVPKNAIEFFDELIAGSIAIHHPKYIGHQVSAPLPLSALAGLVSDILNNGMGIYEMGAAATAMEKVVIESFCSKLGYGSNSDGFLTSGGTLANLTALLSARSNIRNKVGNQKLHILVSEQAHYCIERAAHTMGFEKNQIIKIPTKDDFSISISDLEKSIQELKKDSKIIMAVVASACTTATGTYDSLIEIADICKNEKLWFHIDGAHGGAVAWSTKYRHFMQGSQHADSIVIDAHKMMMIPALATAVLFKNQNDSYRTFQQDAHYLWQDENPEWHNLAKRTYETTKYMASIKIYVILKMYGDAIINDYVTRQYDLTREYADYLETRNDIELCHFPQSNILCFRYVSTENTNQNYNRVNASIRNQIINKGEFYIVQATINKRTYLRITVMNPLTTMKELKALYYQIRDIGINLSNET